jgi:hypothetical protein
VLLPGTPSAGLRYTNVLAIVCYVDVFGVANVRPSGLIAEVNKRPYDAVQVPIEF